MDERHRRGIGYATPVSMALRGGNYARVRNVIQIPWDNIVDSGSALECFFQMPTNTNAIRQAKVWVQQKPYRTPSTTASTVTGGSITTSGDGAGTSGGPSGTIAMSRWSSTSGSLAHTHSDPQGGTTGTSSETLLTDITFDSIAVADSTHAHTNSSLHNHTANIGSHTHALNTTIGETAATGTISLFVANDGTTYGSAIVSGASSITAQSITTQLTTSSGDKRLKITSTGSARVQVLLLLDLVLVPLGPGQ